MQVDKDKGLSKSNLKRLKELTALLDKQTPYSSEHKDVLEKINNLIGDAKKKIDKISCQDTKLQCYESLFGTVLAIINVNNIVQ